MNTRYLDASPLSGKLHPDYCVSLGSGLYHDLLFSLFLYTHSIFLYWMSLSYLLFPVLLQVFIDLFPTNLIV